MTEQSNNKNIKSISQIIKENVANEDDVKYKCMCRINKILQKDELTEQDINELNTLCNILKCCNGIQKINKRIDERAINTKEQGEELKGLVVGTQNFEDWHILRILLKVKMIETLLGGGGRWTQ